MLKPPTLPASALFGGKIAVGGMWLFGLLLLVVAPVGSTGHIIGLCVLGFLVGSHLLELMIFASFLKAANATTADYVLVALFGIFHSGGMTAVSPAP